MADTIRFVLDNRIEYVVFSESSGLTPTTTVLNYLRSLPSHKGVKEGCAEGDCGACTVVLAEAGDQGRLVYRTIDSCLVFLPMIHGKQLITIENLADTRKKALHPVQQMMVESNGSQCGYCTPGVVMSLFGLFKNHHNPPREIMDDALTGNLCRCTGYQPILEAAEKLGKETQSDHFSGHESNTVDMLNSIHKDQETIQIKTGKQFYFRPFTISEALRLRKENPDAIVITGATDVALRQTKKKEALKSILDLSAVEELRFFREDHDSYHIGAGLTLEQLKGYSYQRMPALFNILKVFGSLQIRNVATLGGNVASASPIGDTLPLLIAYQAKIRVRSMDAERIIRVEDFILDYRKTDLRDHELITEIIIPKYETGTVVHSYKVSKRKDMDISTVGAAFRLTEKQGIVHEIILAFGGLAATPKRAVKTEKALTGKPWTQESIMQAMLTLGHEFTPISDARADAAYRKSAGRNLLMKFFIETSKPPQPEKVAVPIRMTDTVKTVHVMPHESAVKHVTGESVFVEDILVNNQLLFGKVVYSKHAHALIRRIDISEALKIPGVHCILTARDIPGENQMGPVVHDEPCLADHEVTFIGQAIALVAAETEATALKAEQLIIIDYEPLPAILDINSAIEAKNSLAPARKIERGNPDDAMKSAPHVIQGELTTGAQEHWYLETQSALAIPGEGKEMLMHASSQNPAETQAIVAEVLGIQKNDVEVEVRRMGGAFGGKETQGNHVAAWAALMANATKRPVKIHLFRDDDQIMTGKRHRFLSRYEIGFDNNGLIVAYKVELNADAGSSTDLSQAILERAMLHADNAYYLPNVSITGQVWMSNLPSNTAFRGFGGPQGMAVIENAIDRIARFLKKDAAEIRYMNFYRQNEHNLTPYGEIVENNHLFTMYGKLVDDSAYHLRRLEINRFNRENEFTKKGLALTPVKFGISFTTAFLNQAGALVNIYTDGTVLVNHGGTEMGQGLHTKILRIVSEELGLSPEKVRVNATNTSKVPNTSPTAASSGSDLNGMAVKNAIDIIKERLANLAITEFEKLHPEVICSYENIVFHDNHVLNIEHPSCKIRFDQLCNLARLNQVSLSATGFYKTPGLYFDRETGQGHPFYYYAYGMAVSEVMIDTLTGAHQLLRTDIIHDVGESLNEGIDKGQVEGGFIQGVGWCTTEEIKWDKEGNQLTHSPDTYKIPTINDIPADFRVEFLQDVPNAGTIRRSKAVGEPPFMLGLSVWLAIKDAISAVDDHEKEPDFSLPATGEVILMSVEKVNSVRFETGKGSSRSSKKNL
ncbi:MAG: xanthine dehydrogenase molybdopterin binding subunit [Bacteroidales bacterium]|nr:xanthine dehydrogenase molybdopterin binding subunit [Bacteroidales bacterium]